MKTPTSQLGKRNDYQKERRAQKKAVQAKHEDKKQKGHAYNQMHYQRDKELAEKHGLNVVSLFLACPSTASQPPALKFSLPIIVAFRILIELLPVGSNFVRATGIVGYNIICLT